jgi:hypothetical protein
MKASSWAIVLLAVGVAAVLAPTAVEAKSHLLAASCSEAVYTTRASAPPRPVQAVRIGPVVFNSLAGLMTPRSLGKPTKKRPVYTVKLPLTILAQAQRSVTITVLGGGRNTAILYDRGLLQRLAGRWHYRFSELPRRVRLSLCHDPQTKRPLNTQYAGGLLLRKPGCVTIQVRAVGDTAAHRATVPVGVRHC